MGLGALEQGQCLGVQGTGFEHKDRNVELQAVDEVGDHHVFGTQAGGLGHGREFGGRALQQGLGFGQLGGELWAGFGVLLGGFGRGLAGRYEA